MLPILSPALGSPREVLLAEDRVEMQVELWEPVAGAQAEARREHTDVVVRVGYAEVRRVLGKVASHGAERLEQREHASTLANTAQGRQE